ncbi:hypothetical protein C8J57DRAFT_1594011 [Mycena rebaudengoi]|nr:hypothetical protein C8J57DRAFT_1594011 [Mycena rebaudengoi]
MPDIAHKIDVTSPLIHYEGNWFPGSAVQIAGNTFSDPDLGKHDQGTSVLCFPGKDHVCSATLNFTGTEIRVVGAYRNQFAGPFRVAGPFQVELDGETSGPIQPPKDEQFQVVLFQQAGLTSGSHTLKLTAVPLLPNLPPPPKSGGGGSLPFNVTFAGVDLDFFTWTTNAVSGSDKDARIQDDNVAFIYQPPDAWSTDMRNLPGFDAGNGHFALNQTDASVTFSFSGDRVDVYGAIGNIGGPFTAQIDDRPVRDLTAEQKLLPAGQNFLADQLIFSADSLSSGNHTLKLISRPVGSPQGLAIDYAVVDGTANNVSSASPTLPSSSEYTSSSTRPTSHPSNKQSQGHRGGLNPAQIGGIAAGISLLFIVLLCALLYLRRRRRNFRSSRLAHALPSPTFVAQFPPDLVAQPTPPSKIAVVRRSSVTSEASDTPSTQPPNYTSLYRDNSV